MIINGSSASTFQSCRQKVWNWRELRLEAKREAESLTVGAAFHAGQAAVYKGGTMDEAQALVEKTYLEEMGPQMILPEEGVLIRQNIRFAQNCVAEHQKHWAHEPIEVLMPEVKFRVPLPNTEHHCFFVHRMLHPEEGELSRGFNERGEHSTPAVADCTDQRCFIPHYYTGTTDAVVSWKGMIWLLEHKTTSVFSDMYLRRYQLDKQARQYIYGISKSTGVRPRGFILNVIRKPRKDAADPTRPTGFVREPYIVSDRELDEVESDLIKIASNYETAFRTGDIYKNDQSCVAYNRLCYYFNSCTSGEIDPDEYIQRKRDYVDLQYYELLGIEPPKETSDAVA